MTNATFGKADGIQYYDAIDKAMKFSSNIENRRMKCANGFRICNAISHEWMKDKATASPFYTITVGSFRAVAHLCTIIVKNPCSVHVTNDHPHRSASVETLRLGLCFVALAVILIVKPFFFQSSFLNFRFNTSGFDSDLLNGIYYYSECKVTILYRTSPNGKRIETYRTISPMTLRKEDTFLASVQSPLRYSFHQTTLQNKKVLYYAHLVVFLPNEEGFQVIKREEISAQPYSQLLVDFLKERINAGEWSGMKMAWNT